MGAEHTINFSVENTGTLEATYSIDMINITNNFADKKDLVYSITSTNNGGQKQTTIAPSSNQTILSGVKIAADEKQEYSLTLNFKETGDNQNDNQGKAFSGLIQLNATNNIILPTEYQKIEYLETTGTQYIDTGIILSNNFEVRTTYSFVSNSTQFVCGTRTNGSSSDSFTIIKNGSMMGYDLGGTTSNRSLSSSSTNQKYSVQFSFDNNSAKYSVNGTLISTKSHTRTTNNYPLYINTNNFGKIMS